MISLQKITPTNMTIEAVEEEDADNETTALSVEALKTMGTLIDLCSLDSSLDTVLVVVLKFTLRLSSISMPLQEVVLHTICRRIYLHLHAERLLL